MGYGSDWVHVDTLERDVRVDLPTEDWHETVIADALWFDEYGAPFDLRELPEPMFQAHLAILRGRRERRQDEMDDDGGA